MKGQDGPPGEQVNGFFLFFLSLGKVCHFLLMLKELNFTQNV